MEDGGVKLNHRKLLDGMLAICGVPQEKFRTICSSIDKLDKQSFEPIKKKEKKKRNGEALSQVGMNLYILLRWLFNILSVNGALSSPGLLVLRSPYAGILVIFKAISGFVIRYQTELVYLSNGGDLLWNYYLSLSDEISDRIGIFVKWRGPPVELLSKLKQERSFLENNESSLALDELDIMFKALERSRCIDRVVFDLSLARGLDYYTGVIFEAIFKGVTQVGSIAAGGRYDNLIGMFGTRQVPAVRISLGIERVLAIMEQVQKDKNQVIVAK
uniref:Histidine--tRNA ligase-like n=1 Tax=Nicotiana sylvestris TaxID=4096 RepID=A0A1U7VK40_NICSY|nr:PREDICTED: histidine--tRNA ligase-like [Nicotiana sylvestris]